MTHAAGNTCPEAREQGIIIQRKRNKAFGFISCPTCTRDVFFHINDLESHTNGERHLGRMSGQNTLLPSTSSTAAAAACGSVLGRTEDASPLLSHADGLVEGTEVEFDVIMDKGKPVAKHIQLLPPGSVRMFKLDALQLLGQVVLLPLPSHVTIMFGMQLETASSRQQSEPAHPPLAVQHTGPARRGMIRYLDPAQGDKACHAPFTAEDITDPHPWFHACSNPSTSETSAQLASDTRLYASQAGPLLHQQQLQVGDYVLFQRRYDLRAQLLACASGRSSTSKEPSLPSCGPATAVVDSSIGTSSSLSGGPSALGRASKQLPSDAAFTSATCIKGYARGPDAGKQPHVGPLQARNMLLLDVLQTAMEVKASMQ